MKERIMTKRTLKSLQNAMSAAYVLSDSAFVDPGWINKHLAAADPEPYYPDRTRAAGAREAKLTDWAKLPAAKPA
jgi:hypothetical protein